MVHVQFSVITLSDNKEVIDNVDAGMWYLIDFNSLDMVHVQFSVITLSDKHFHLCLSNEYAILLSWECYNVAMAFIILL